MAEVSPLSKITDREGSKQGLALKDSAETSEIDFVESWVRKDGLEIL